MSACDIHSSRRSLTRLSPEILTRKVFRGAFPHDLRASQFHYRHQPPYCSALRGCGRCGRVFERLLVACGGSSSTSENADADTPQISPSASARTDFSGEVTFDNYEKKGNFVPATESAPAQNVPFPKRPASASENVGAGSVRFDCVRVCGD